VDGESRGADAAWLHKLRASRGLSQEQLARLLGVSFATVNRWETGKTRMPARAREALASLAAAGPAAGEPATQPLVTRLPVTQSSFVGRERELAGLIPLLRESRLVTLAGPGGVGKTRLAVEALTRHPPAVPAVFVALSTVWQPDSLLAVLASALQVPDQAGLPLAEAVTAAVADTPRTVVLDGAEHLRDAVAELAGRLLAASDQVRVVVTSQVVLGVPGEVCWTVPPLGCPPEAGLPGAGLTGAGRPGDGPPGDATADIGGFDAVRLFTARAGDRVTGFSLADGPAEAVGELCRRLDGLPLAIELIAGWVAVLPVAEILRQRAVLLAQDSPGAGSPGSGGERRRLADVIRASYDLLTPDEQRLVAALGVFAGPFTAADAEAVSGVGSGLARLLRGLVDSSWLEVTRGTEYHLFSMLDTMRGFAADRLEESGAANRTRLLHARHFTALAADSESGLASADAAAWGARLDAAAADLDQALRWSLDAGETGTGLDLATGLWRWWLARGRLGDGRAWLGRMIAAAGPGSGEPAGRALTAAAVLAAENGDYAEAIRAGRHALRILTPLLLPERTATAATVLGSAYRYLGRRADARRSFGQALELRSGLGDRRALAVALNNMALAEMDDGDLARARSLLEQALGIKRQLGERQSVAIGLVNLGELLTRAGQWGPAEIALAEAAELAAGLGVPQLTGTVRTNQGNVAAHQRRWADAAAHYATAVAAYLEIGHGHDAVEAMTGLGLASHRLGRRDEASRHLRAAEALAGELGNAQRVSQVRAALAETGADAAGPPPGGLTTRQAEVLRLLASGMSNKQIAVALYLSPATVERHLVTVYRKLRVTGRVDATRYAVAHGLVPVPVS
jgi:predicted ATPase/DNA-binding CsgD family transcriptional regulator